MGNEKQTMNKISREIISMAASKAALSVPGTDQEKGVKISGGKDGLIIDIYITVLYGVKIPQLAWDIQNSVKEAVEKITVINVKAVNINIEGVVLPGKNSKGSNTNV